MRLAIKKRDKKYIKLVSPAKKTKKLQRVHVDAKVIPSSPLQEQTNKPLNHKRPDNGEGQTGWWNVKRPPWWVLEEEHTDVSRRALHNNLTKSQTQTVNKAPMQYKLYPILLVGLRRSIGRQSHWSRLQKTGGKKRIFKSSPIYLVHMKQSDREKCTIPSGFSFLCLRRTFCAEVADIYHHCCFLSF